MTTEAKLLIIVHGLMLAWLAIDVLLLRHWIKSGHPPRMPDTVIVAVLFAGGIILSLVYLVLPAVQDGHEGRSHGTHHGSP